jgi:hypothetical protein
VTSIAGEAFSRGFTRWVQGIGQVTDGEVVAIDGKTLRRTVVRASSDAAIHLVSAWASCALRRPLTSLGETWARYTASMQPFTKVIGVYDADGGMLGELRYLLGKLTGSAHCALCDVTHGLNPRGKADWLACAREFPVELVMLHRNEQDVALAELTRGALPCVVGERSDGSRELLVTRQQLEACNGSVAALSTLLQEVVVTADRR